MPPPATLTGQDVGEAEGALTALLDQLLAGTSTGITRAQYIVLRILALRGPAESPAALHDYLAGQPQLHLDHPQVAELFRDLEAGGLVTGSAPDGPGPTQLTPDGAASTPGSPTPSPTSQGACMPTSTQTTSPPPTGSWSRSPNAPATSAANPETPHPAAATPRQPGRADWQT